MATLTNTITSDQYKVALDQEFLANFRQEGDRLNEILGNFGFEVVHAGTALYQLKVTGSLNESAADAGSSGAAYVEGDEVALSKYAAEKVPMGSVTIKPYRKRTTAQAIQQNGYVAAVARTDKKMLSDVRKDILKEFFAFLENGTGAASGTTLQAALANADAALADAMEDNGDGSPSGVVHLVNRQDAAAYLGAQPVTTQTAFGMTYLESFLGVESVLLTNQVAKGSFWVTPKENVHVLTADYSELAKGGISYATEQNGLVGVAHTPAYDHVSTDTHVVTAMTLFPEITDYIINGTIAPAA